ncbi:MAG: hypothetical protein KAV87_59120, partial [Desulfobacteraceae bacterium]|nr:hypothetical protein [Desulfobacteraceae bacterium]
MRIQRASTVFQISCLMAGAGDDFDSDMGKMAADPTTQKWWDVCTRDSGRLRLAVAQRCSSSSQPAD